MPQYPQFLNHPRSFVTDALRGLAESADDLLWHADPGYAIRREPAPRGTVALVSGGGSGHEPLHTGFVGRGMLTAACPGLVFTSPNAVQVRAATQAADAGGGVLHIVKNYTGDVLNFRIAADMAGEEGTDVETVLVADDVATEPATGPADGDGPGARGTAATVAVEKICGAAAERGDGLAAVAALGRRVAGNARSMAVALRACTLPGADRPSFDLPDGETELGIGIHGERGTERVPATTAHEVVGRLVPPIADSLGLAEGEQVIAIVNGLGATHPLELHVLYGELADHLAERGVRIARPLVGSFVTALDMAGASITLVRADDEMLRLWDAPTKAPGWPNAPATAHHRIGQDARRPGEDTGPGLPRADGGASGGDSGAADADHAPGRKGAGAWLTAWIERVCRAEPELTELDRQAGDGDFGANMLAALSRVDVDALRGGAPADAFAAVSDAYLQYAGGTSGALFGVWFRHLCRAAADAHGAELDAGVLASGTRAGLDAITDLAGARVGDKTMVDALDPAVRELEAAAAEGGGLEDALARAARAAADGVESTAGITASRGRASYVGEAAREVTDPGALVMAWLFEEAASSSV